VKLNVAKSQTTFKWHDGRRIDGKRDQATADMVSGDGTADHFTTLVVSADGKTRTIHTTGMDDGRD
jgi:hypothetical protein